MGILNWWRDACGGETHFGNVTVSQEALAMDNVQWTLQCASHGRYGNALQALGSHNAVVSFNHVASRVELVRHHP